MAFSASLWSQLKNTTADELISALERDGLRVSSVGVVCFLPVEFVLSDRPGTADPSTAQCSVRNHSQEHRRRVAHAAIRSAAWSEAPTTIWLWGGCGRRPG
jgi:hypothetical protein